MLYYLEFYYIGFDEHKAPIENRFGLGVFNSLEKIESAIEYYKNQSGFSEYDNGFRMTFLGFPSNLDIVYAPYYAHIGKYPSEDNENMFGFYDTLEEAQSVLNENIAKRSNLDKNDFGIDKWTVNKLEWKEGFD